MAQKGSGTEDHHVVPLSLWGWDLPINIVNLPIADHKLLHQKQNVPYDIIRNFQKKSNHLDRNSAEFKVEYLKLLLAFFSGAMLLPLGLIRVQFVAIRGMVLWVCKEKKIKPPEDLSKDAEPIAHLLHWVTNFVVLCSEIFFIIKVF